MMAPGTSSMLRARRRDVNVKPNRRLDRKSSRGMLYENEELRLRTININAEVERGQNDIKKLRRENDQLRREIWGLREEYDRLEGLLGKAKRRGQLGNTSQDEDSDNEDGYEDEDGEYDEEEEDDDEDTSPCENSADLDNAENQQKASSSSIRTPGPSRRNSLRVEFDGLSIVDEETETVSNDVTPVEQCAEEGACATNASRQGAIFFGGVKPQDGEACAPISNRDECFNNPNGRQRHEQQFFGKIKLPNGKEGVFMSDAVLPNSNISNGLPIYGANNLKGNSYDFGPVVGFGPNDYHILNENVWSDIPTLLPGAAQNVIPSGTAMFPTSQSHYNYTFTPVDSTMLPTGASTQDNNYAFERPNNFPGIPDADAVLPNVATGREPRTEHVYLEGGRNTIMHDSGVNDDAYFGMGENMATTTTGDEIIPDYYHRRGGPDLFISGAYPVTRSPGVFPVGGNLDQLLKQMSSNENESVPTVEVTEATCSDTTLTKSESNGKEVPQKDAVGHVQEVIDALETQIDSKLNDAVRGVRVVNGNCYVCLTKEDNAGALLETGLTLRGAKINLENASRDSVIVALSGVPHDVSDSSVTRIVANYGAVTGDVERRMYKGVDTGERFVRLKPADADIKNVPSTINLAGSKATLRILKPDEVEELGCACVPKSMGDAGATEDKTKDASKKQTQYGENPSKSLDSSFSADRYRSQLNVRLKQPNLKTNRSLDNIFDSTSDRTQHNTSLPIIDACDTTPAKLPSETRLSETRYKKPCEGTVNFDGLESALPPKLSSLLQSETISALSASGQEAKSKETATREGRKLTQEQELDLLLQENRILKTFVVREPQSSPEVAINNTPNIFSKLPTRKSKCQNAQILSTTDESTDSAELHLKASPQLQSNPFVGNFRTASPNNAVFPGYFRRPITPAQINPFISTTPNPNHGIVYEDITLRGERSSVQCPPHFPIYQGDLPPLDHQRQLLLSQGTSNSRACSPYSHINASYPHSNQPPNIAFVSNEAVYIPNSAGTSFPGTSSLPTTIALFSSNPSAASATAGLPQGSHVHPSAGYFHNPPIPSTAALMPPSNTIMSGNTGYFHPNATNIAASSTTYVPGSVAIVVPPSMSIPGSAEHFQMPPDLPTNTHPGHLSTAQSANISMPKASSPNTSTFPPSQQNSSQIPPEPPSHHEGNKQRQEHTDVTENTLEVPRTQSTSVPSSPVSKQIAQTKAPRKSSIISRQQSKSSGDEGPNLSPPAVHKVTAPASPGAARRKTSRKVSCTNSIASHHNVDNSINESSTGSAGGPNATSSPNTKHRSSVIYHRKTSTGAAGGADASGGVHANVIDVSRSSSSGQDSPTKPDRRRRVSIYFNNKKGAGKRRDSVFVPNGSSAPSGGILTRSLSLEHSHRYPGGSSTNVAGGHCAGAETTTTTCSERERTNSASSRTSSAAGGLGSSRLRKQSVCSNRGGSGSDVGKVPWCGCWGNGCI